MTQGVIILSLMKKSYPMGAYNLALSIKHFNPSIQITLVSDNEHQKHYRPEHYKVFDTIKTISRHHYIDDGMFQPALAKLNINKYSSYDKTLYIDADSLVLQDLQPLFDKLDGQEFKSNVIPGYTQWTDAETFRSFFGIGFGDTINSSWFYFTKDCRVFGQAVDYWRKGFDPDKISPKWGLSLPDEMFFNASINALKISPLVDFEVMFFGGNIDARTNSEIEMDCFMLTLYGGKKTVRSVYVDLYDGNCRNMSRAKGQEHLFKARDILSGKHVQNK